MLRILLVHNSYQQRGGEDSVVENELALLRSYGHQVELYFRHNDELSGLNRFSIFQQAIWSGKTYCELNILLQRFKPDVIHVHNTLSLISPSLYWVAAKFKIPVVQTLHNFRLLCPQAMFLRKGNICERCIGRNTWRSVIHRCYRSSLSQSAVVSGMLHLHRGLGTYKNNVSRYIALNSFCKNKFIEGGLPAEKIRVKPNFIPDINSAVVQRNGFLFAGRLSPEKGLHVLVRAFNHQSHGQLSVAGTGEDSFLLAQYPAIKQLGILSAGGVCLEMQKSAALILPSIWYENMPMILLEAFMNGLPVIASRIGALAELVEEGVTGLLFNVGDSADLAKKMQWAVDHPDFMLEMGKNARNKYLSAYSSEVNINLLLAIYKEAIADMKPKNILLPV
ncbi:glycosyltransferase involved in cell wall biosynthesis [Iodobacter fluviatilis]|uniref:GDP-mannose-dependent alpha-mannosyltransferase n=2 Tax=Iodobacter fluviatilis TaxID=537 RepID=A0A377SYX6_9NEIS|nr:glycosyltransferase involved in cell wall biosynthesis [Iodobacter fluviatilis]STR45536.1 GDP-mannose-dependent alpha-mannosyltransferase [Iodobacter fluviatilis]